MMTYSAMLLPATDIETMTAQFRTARTLGAGHAHLIVGLDVIEPTPFPHPSELVWGAEVINSIERTQTDMAAKMRASFTNLCKAEGVVLDPDTKGEELPKVAARWEVLHGLRDTMIANYARQMDLVIIAQQTEQQLAPAQAVVQSVLARSGRPLLLTPPEGMGRLPKKTLVCWNGSQEAARALQGALSLLKVIGHAHVVSVGKIKRDVPIASAIAEHLRRHGIVSSHAEIDTNQDKVRTRLEAEADRVGAELMVMGAYSQARWQEMILGGVTKGTLQKVSIPTIMAH